MIVAVAGLLGAPGNAKMLLLVGDFNSEYEAHGFFIRQVKEDHGEEPHNILTTVYISTTETP